MWCVRLRPGLVRGRGCRGLRAPEKIDFRGKAVEYPGEATNDHDDVACAGVSCWVDSGKKGEIWEISTRLRP